MRGADGGVLSSANIGVVKRFDAVESEAVT
jgi:hypothetical protein